MHDLPRLAELHVIPRTKSRGFFPKICISCIHETSRAVKFTDELTAAYDMRFNIDPITAQSQLQHKAVFALISIHLALSPHYCSETTT